jgi:hypothetical protein
MRKELEENYYLHLRNFIDPSVAAKLAAEFEEDAEANGVGGDDQIPGSKARYDSPSIVRLLVQKTPVCSVYAEEALLPTYSYGRVYRKGDVLQGHRDRPACEVSVTLNLAKTENWPICLKTSAGINVCIELAPGDAVMYLGTKAEHWRPEYTGDHHVQVFLHYVMAHGDNAWAYFDKVQTPPTNP